MFIQADFGERALPNNALPHNSGFVGTGNAIEAEADQLGRPMLLVHGDEHYFPVALLLNPGGKPIPGVTERIAYGEGLPHNISEIINPDSAGVFGFKPSIMAYNVSN